MPSSSRKKNKGKDRKAKKAAEKEEARSIQAYITWRHWASGERADGTVVTQCNHGLAEIPDDFHPVSKFIHDLFTNPSREAVLRNNPQVCNNETNRELAVQMLIRIIATNLLIDDDAFNLAWGISDTILLLDNYDETFGKFDDNFFLARHIRSVATRRRDLSPDCRDVLKFYRKRTNCKCLKKMHLEARKTMPKLGSCHHCGVEKERTLLMVCSRCRIAQYCSRECQVAASSKHREDCDMFVYAHEHTIAIWHTNTRTQLDMVIKHDTR